MFDTVKHIIRIRFLYFAYVMYLIVVFIVFVFVFEVMYTERDEFLSNVIFLVHELK